MAVVGEDLKRIEERLNELGEALWASAEEVCKSPVIHPQDIMGLVGPAVGEIHGLSALIGWHCEHQNEREQWKTQNSQEGHGTQEESPEAGGTPPSTG